MATAYSVPYLPLDSPQFLQPFAIKLPLFKHQLRSLYRMRQIEAKNAQEGQVEPFNSFRFGENIFTGPTKEYISKGGVLCDAIGMGKTATILALICSEDRSISKGGNLIICPPHLVQQWSNEVNKFVKEGELEIISGLKNYLDYRGEISNRTIVLCSVDDLLDSKHYYYSDRTLYSDEFRIKKARVTERETQLFRTVSFYILGGTGSYKGPMWSTSLHFPSKNWSRVIFEEVQDLVEPGKKALDCFTQLTWGSEYVWLVTATPFPKGNASASANGKLLGFRRYNFNIPDGDKPLDPSSPFETVKRKLYLRNHDRESEEAIANTIAVTNTEIEYPLTEAEKLFFTIQREVTGSNIWHEDIRKVSSHPCGGTSFDKKMELLGVPLTQLVEKFIVNANKSIGSTEAEIFHRKVTLRATETSLAVIREILSLYDSSQVEIRKAFDMASRTTFPSIFSLSDEGGAAPFRIFINQAESMRQKKNGDPIISGSEIVLNFVLRYLTNRAQQEFFANQMELNLANAKTSLNELSMTLSTHKGQCSRAIQTLKQLKNVKRSPEQHAGIVEKYGSRIANLVKYVSASISEQQKRIVVFSDWEFLLRKSADALRLVSIDSVIFASTPDCESRDAALNKFLNGTVNVLMLCSRTTSAGINLQMASEVIFLDPPGSKASHGAALWKQAMGRVLRMGQKNAVKSVRLIAADTCDRQLYKEIDDAIVRSVKVSRNQSSKLTRSAYVCEGYDMPIPELPPARKEKDSKASAEDDGVEIIAEISGEERLRKRLQDAEVIDISDSDEPKPKISRIEVVEEKSKTIAAATIVKVEKQKAVRKSSRTQKIVESHRTAGDRGVAAHPPAVESTSSSSSSTVYNTPVASQPPNPEVLHTADRCTSINGNTTSEESLAIPDSESSHLSSKENYNILDVQSCSFAKSATSERLWSTSEFWLCPLSKKILRDAVVAADGHSYEREYIERYMAGKLVVLSPVTGLQLPHLLLTPNIALKSAISKVRRV